MTLIYSRILGFVFVFVYALFGFRVLFDFAGMSMCAHAVDVSGRLRKDLLAIHSNFVVHAVCAYLISVCGCTRYPHAQHEVDDVGNLGVCGGERSEGGVEPSLESIFLSGMIPPMYILL